ncbi:MAG: peptide ABC transporter substrate-binding protein [Ruminococcaceae bacterium]|nr:peptide ABC transporter substrate-binding protein [Oscillospiraceae bacterium]
MRFKRFMGAAVSAALVLSVIACTGCSKDDGENYIFKYDIAQNPRTLDPQTATDSSSYEIIANMFEGLLQIDNDGNIQNAVAEKYTISPDGLVYTFDLRQDVFWTDGDKFEAQCTANDFVFAFQRLFRPSTKSKTAGDFFCIKNAKEINKGSITDMSELGVKAEGDFKLVITLEAPTPSFLSMLTTAPAMPCNEEYYNSTDGRYGLYADSIASNGAFYLFRWNYDQWSKDNNSIIMRANKKNKENQDIYPYGLNFFIEEDDSYQNFLDESNHVYIASGANAIRLLNKGYEYSESENRIWGIVFNTKSSAFKSEELRKALAYSIDREKATLESEVGYNKAQGIVPSIIKIGTESYRELVKKDCLLPYSGELADSSLEKALEDVDKSSWSGLTLYVPDDDVIFEYISDIAQQWQYELNFYCNIKRLDQSSYETTLNNGNYDFIVADISGTSNSPYAYLSSFLSGNSNNYANYKNSEFEDILSEGESAATEKESADLFYKAEEAIVNSGVFIPLITQSEYAFFGEGCQGIVYNPFTKTVIFKEAKMF